MAAPAPMINTLALRRCEALGKPLVRWSHRAREWWLLPKTLPPNGLPFQGKVLAFLVELPQKLSQCAGVDLAPRSGAIWFCSSTGF